MRDIVIGILAVVGAFLVFLSGAGVLRFPDLYARMHAATKASTMGIALVSAAGALAIDDGAAKIVLAAAVIFITVPGAAHFVGRSAYGVEGVEIRIEGRDDLDDLDDLMRDGSQD